MSRRIAIEEAAARWLLRSEEAEWSVVDQATLDAWLEESPEHKVAYWRLEMGWREADRLAALKSPPSPRDVKRRVRDVGWRLIGGASIAAAFLAMFMSINLLEHRTYGTEVGGHQTVPLADGTKVELNTATQLRAKVDARGRAVWLDRGEAYFEVAHDPRRPFVVHAGDRTVTVLGTKFSVRRNDDQVEVAVIEGRVRIDAVEAERPTPPTIVTRGDIVIAAGRSTLVEPKSVERVANELTWRQGLLTFDQTTLGDVAAEFNRYNRKSLKITDPAAAAIRINGRFEADNVEDFARLLRQGFGLKVEDDGERIQVSS